ncbi:MAG: UDP-3-O-(3-hydroxymyristoyl)glucosamine N-acyltransferase [Bauldia sp.]
MADPVFFVPSRPLTAAEIASTLGATLPPGADADRAITRLAPLDQAGPSDLSFMDNPRYAGELAGTHAGICLTAPRFLSAVPPRSVAIPSSRVHRDLAIVAGLLFPQALRPLAVTATVGISPAAYVDPGARLEDGVTVEPMAVIGPGAEIGRGTLIAAGAVIGREVRIGRDCLIGPGASLLYALIGNRVIIHPGVRIGQDGFGYASAADGHRKIPQLGRVIVQDNVEIGAGTTIDRGAIRDTVVGEGTKIDNLVQIGHNVVIGRHCLIVAQVGISGSATLGDFVVIGGQSGVNGHVNIGDGAQIAAVSTVHGDVPPGARWGGTPAGPVREWLRAMTEFKKLGRPRSGDQDDTR